MQDEDKHLYRTVSNRVGHKSDNILCLKLPGSSLNLLAPTYAQLYFIKNHLKNSYMFRSTTIFRELQYPR